MPLWQSHRKTQLPLAPAIQGLLLSTRSLALTKERRRTLFIIAVLFIHIRFMSIVPMFTTLTEIGCDKL